MIAALDRHLNDKGYKFSIIRDWEFHSSKQVLEGKARQLRQSGMGKRPNKARSLTEEEEEVLWEAEKFGSKTPEALISSMCMVAFDVVIWSPRPSRTPRNENGRFSTLQK